jgi:hypothetical protein
VPVTALLPDVVLDAVRSRTVLETSGSYGLVAVALLAVLLFQLEAARAVAGDSARTRMISAVVGPLFVAVALVIGARVASLMP